MKCCKVPQFFLWLFAFVILSYETKDGTHNLDEQTPTLLLDFLHLTQSSKLSIDILSPQGSILSGYLGWMPQHTNSSYTRCSKDSQENTMRFKYEKGMELSIMQDSAFQCEDENTHKACHTVTCYRVQWKNHISGAMDCYNLGDHYWYGGDITLSQRWPIQYQSHAWCPAVTGDPLHHPSGSVQENSWFSSGGFLIHVEPQVPLFYSFNMSGNNRLCLSTSRKHPYQSLKGHTQELTYSICSGMSVRDAKQYAAYRWQHKPNGTPEKDLFQNPVWSTWARYKRDINESIIFDFARKIKEAGLPASQLEIDDKWENCYGNLEFDMAKFPNPKRMTREIKALGMLTTLWVHPFCNIDCKCYGIGEVRGFWVKDRDGKPVEVKWWNGGRSVLLDTTNKEATEWFQKKLERLKNVYEIDSFKFDAGEALWLDKKFVLEDKASQNPNTYSKEYAKLAAKFGGRVEVRVGFGTQELPVFVRMFDKSSLWDYANGLQTLIPHALQLSVLGYKFILPDMIGGNNYMPHNGSLPDRELYVRWFQANIFMPAMQFSIAPFDYDDKVLKITKKLLTIREHYANYMLNEVQKQNEAPLIRPLWWIAPDDDTALVSDSQFLLGDSVMVAPVLSKGATERDIYLPAGRWEDPQRGHIYEGYQWLYNYKAPLSFLPFFIRH